jgi:ABC-type multidrug transport system fused ATPase/permease subunit
MGVAALSGMGVIFLSIFIQYRASISMIHLRKLNATNTDSRISLTQEVFQAMKLVKFFAWEDLFSAKILNIRHLETNAIVKATYLRSVTVAFGFATPALAASLSFIVYGLLVDNPETAIIFSSMSLFNQLRNLITWGPILLSSLTDAKVALGRIQDLMDAEEQSFQSSLDFNLAHAVEIQSGSFSWTPWPKLDERQIIVKAPTIEYEMKNMTAPASTLKSINLRVPKGALCGVFGAVGTGKSSLLSAIIGEMYPVQEDTSIKINGQIGCCPQQAWIINASIRDNILIGRPYDPEVYKRIIYACALESDFAVYILAH